MGVTNTGQQQQPAAPMTPQQQQLRGLQTAAMTPYSGNARGGAAPQGVAQLAAALMARNKQQALLKGNPGAAQRPLPVAQNPVSNMPLPGAAPPPMAGGGMGGGAPPPMGGQTFPAPNPQAMPQLPPQQAGSPMMQSIPGLTPGNPAF